MGLTYAATLVVGVQAVVSQGDRYVPAGTAVGISSATASMAAWWAAWALVSNTVRVDTTPTTTSQASPWSMISPGTSASSPPQGQGRGRPGLSCTGANVLPLIGLALVASSWESESSCCLGGDVELSSEHGPQRTFRAGLRAVFHHWRWHLGCFRGRTTYIRFTMCSAANGEVKMAKEAK